MIPYKYVDFPNLKETVNEILKIIPERCQVINALKIRKTCPSQYSRRIRWFWWTSPKKPLQINAANLISPRRRKIPHLEIIVGWWKYSSLGPKAKPNSPNNHQHLISILTCSIKQERMLLRCRVRARIILVIWFWEWVIYHKC